MVRFLTNKRTKRAFPIGGTKSETTPNVVGRFSTPIFTSDEELKRQTNKNANFFIDLPGGSLKTFRTRQEARRFAAKRGIIITKEL